MRDAEIIEAETTILITLLYNLSRLFNTVKIFEQEKQGSGLVKDG